ncbi:MAG: DEAD/DEAH box helicase [Victivallales bacterium]|nr:DEAD/DEAH box helicase [Victivallales bacterium]
MIKPVEDDTIAAAAMRDAAVTYEEIGDAEAHIAAPADPALHRELPENTRAFFRADGPLSRLDSARKYEYRPQQEAMAEAAAMALAENHNLCVEAPTGVGKSFAYLVPAIHFAVKESRPVVISTETINLQEQLLDKDIPLLRQVIGVEFKAALAKGRSNYVCLRRLYMAVGERQAEFFPDGPALAEAKRITRWLEGHPGDGSKADIPFNCDGGVWANICCEGGNCRGPKCSFFRQCYYWKARRSWDQADIIISNHALFFADHKMKIAGEVENTLLPPYAALIVDEAHTLEDNAAEHLGLRITQTGFHYFLRRLFNSKGGGGLLLRAGKETLELRETVAELEGLSQTFFAMVEQLLIDRNESGKLPKKQCKLTGGRGFESL